MNNTPSHILPYLASSYGSYTPLGQATRPAVIQSIEVSGYTPTPQGVVPFNRVRLNPAQTKLQGYCTCGIYWQNHPLHLF